MASSATPPGTVDGEDSIATLKRLREAEAEGDARLAAVKAETSQRLGALQTEKEAALAQARVDAQQLHDAMISAARREIDQEAQRILDAGAAEAAGISVISGKALEAIRDALLDALFGEFRTSRPPAE